MNPLAPNPDARTGPARVRTVPPRIPALALAALLAVSGRPAAARVFWPRPAPRGAAVLDATPGWSRLLEGAVTINQGTGELAVYGCDEPLPAVVERLRTAFRLADALDSVSAGETMALLRARQGRNRVTVLALAPDIPDRTVLFVLTQSPEAFEGARRAPETPPRPDPPPYPNSRLETVLAYTPTRVELACYSAAAPPPAIQAYYADILQAGGWQRLDPGPAAVEAPGLTLYRKGTSLCGLLILPQPDGTGSSITVLHKQTALD